MQCPDENTLVAFAHQMLGKEETASVDSHLRGCAECRQVIAMLVEGTSTPGPQGSPEAAPAPDSGEPLPALPERVLPPGTQLGRYILLKPLGVGGMGMVYAAYDSELARTVALKLLRQGQTPSEEARARLQREARAMARLTSPFVLPVYDVGTWHEQVFVIMELVEGGTLTGWLAERPRGWREVLRVFLDAGRGLAAAHAAGLVHRDFKPDNVLVGADTRIRVTDFGLARATESPELPAGTRPSKPAKSHESVLTQQGALVGTPAYMSPEQREGQPADARSDQFSFCVALYEGLYGERPFAADSSGALDQAIHEGKIRPPPARTRVPAWLRRVVLRGLSVAPQGRFAAMEELLVALQDDPGVRRRRWVLGAGALGLLLAVAGVTQQVGERRSQVCKGAERKLEGIWDGAIRQKAEAAFLATGEPYAANAWNTTATWLDRYAAQWVGAHVEACEATHVRGEQSEQALDLRMACLERRRRALGALTKVLSEADADLLVQAPSAVEGLAPVAGCADVEALRTRPTLPEAEPQRSRAEALTQKLAEVQALYETGRYAPGLELGQKSLEEARALGFAPLVAEATLWVGQLHARLGDEKTGEKTVLEAVVAAHASGRLDVAMAGYEELSLLTRQKPEEAMEWSRFASALIQANGDDPIEQANQLNNEGLILLEAGKPEEATERMLQAVKLMESHTGPDSSKLATLLNNTAAVLHQRARYAEALPLAVRSVAIDERAMGPDYSELAPTLHTIATIHVIMGNGAEALKAVQRSISLVERTMGPEFPMMPAMLNTLGSALALEGRDAEAWETYQRSVALEEKLQGAESPGSLGTLVNMSRLLLQQGRTAEARTYAERAAQLAQKVLGPEHPKTAVFRVDVGRCLLAQGQAARALALFEQALAVEEKAQGPESADVPRGLTGLGQALVELGRPDQAIAPLKRALLLRKEARPDDAAATRFALAQALTAAGKEPARALALEEEAREGFRKAGPRAERELAKLEQWSRHHAPAAPSGSSR